ncbi:hypothetical protein [Leuconostoc gasicomitatum]|uniref:hypothetical protein n=1 Tax=Leuconostoc gasicomitatum TaxID=115778 RepID=UPI001CC441D3|nr:hypothetical protein [Leuconostoc gasicomitatum]MBZ5968842.1 hypothetical protein [Leuconostoc gasicomitatum]
MAEHYGIYLTTHDNKTFELPIMPSEISVNRVMDVSQNTVITLGEIDQVGKRKLNETTIEGIIPVLPQKSHLITASSIWANGRDYIGTIENWQSSQKPGRYVVTGSRQMSGRVTVSSFQWGMKDGNSSEFYFSLTIREWRDYSAKKIAIKPNKTTPKKPAARPAPPKKIGIGSRVIVNGQLFRDSYGTGGGLTERNADRKITLIANGRSKPYHVALVNGGARGWVSASSVRLK